MRSVRRTASSLATWAAVILGVLSVDFLLSWIFRGPIDSAFPRPQNVQVSSTVFHHGLAPKVSAPPAAPGSSPLITNSLGFRDEIPRDVPLTTGARRLLIIGDATTEGSGVSYEESFVGLLSERLANEGVEVLNAAAHSYSPAIYYAKIKYLLEQVGLQIDEVMVLIDISDIEDEARLYALDGEGRVVDTASDIAAAPDLDRWGNDLRSRFMTARAYFMIRERLRGMGPTQSSSSGLGRRPALWTVDDSLYAEFGQQGLEKAEEHMGLLRGLLAKRGIPMVVVVYPWPDQVARRDLQSKQVVFWRTWSEENDVGFLDLFPTFIHDAPAEEVLERYWIPGDVHWNAAGHALVADVIGQAYFARTRALGSAVK